MMLRKCACSSPLAALAISVLALGCVASAQERIEHLLQAADHLAKAGEPELAAKVRELAVSELGDETEQLLAAKLAEWKRLESEIVQLRQMVDTGPQVMIHVQVYQLDQERMQGGLGPVSLLSLLNDQQVTPMVDEDGSLTQFIDFLQQQRMLKILAEPSLVTVAGRTATFVAGRERRTAGASRVNAETPAPVGLRLVCTPTMTEKQSIQIDLDLSLGNGPPPGQAEGPKSPGVVNIASKFDVPPGKTVLISSPGKEKDGDAAKGLFIFLTAELVQAAHEVE